MMLHANMDLLCSSKQTVEHAGQKMRLLSKVNISTFLQQAKFYTQATAYSIVQCFSLKWHRLSCTQSALLLVQ